MHVVGDGHGVSASRAGPRWIVVMKGVPGFGERGTLESQVGFLADGVSVGDQVTLGRPSKVHRQAPAGREDKTTGAGEVVCARTIWDYDSIGLMRKQGMSESNRVSGRDSGDRVHVAEQQVSQD